MAPRPCVPSPPLYFYGNGFLSASGRLPRQSALPPRAAAGEHVIDIASPAAPQAGTASRWPEADKALSLVGILAGTAALGCQVASASISGNSQGQQILGIAAVVGTGASTVAAGVSFARRYL